MKQILISSITISDRSRKSFKHIGDLSESIKRYGLIHPILVEPIDNDKYLLIAGERRLRACILLEKTEISVTFREDLTLEERKEIELEENIRREDLDWTEEVEIKRKLDEIKRKLYGHSMQRTKTEGWNITKTAESLNISLGHISEDLQLARFLKDHPERKPELQKLPKTAALRRIKLIEESDKIQRLVSSGQLKTSHNLILGDALTELKKLKDNSIDLVLTDPPYGIQSLSGPNKGTKNSLMNMEDNLSPKTALILIFGALVELERVLKPGRHLYTFTTPEHFMKIHSFLRSLGFITQTAPLIWYKGKATTIFTGLSYTRNYEMIIFAIKEAPKPRDIKPLRTAGGDVISRFSSVPPKQRQHAFEKPLDLLRYLIEQSSSVGDVILDPFCGVGSTLLAAKTIRRNFLGIELQEIHYNKALKSLNEGE